jgi:L-lactate dehydrogenase complex protein LldG
VEGPQLSDTTEPNLIAVVRKALGRDQPISTVPIPPAIDESIARLVDTGADLRPLFLQNAAEAKFHIDLVNHENLPEKLAAFLKSQNCQLVGMSISPLLEKLDLKESLKCRDIDLKTWDELTLDVAYELDCGITDVWAAVAETASLAILPDTKHGRALSLFPPIHIAIVEPKNLVADLLDLTRKMSAIQPPPQITLITGPSKTADIEGSLVTGVHGPGFVQIFFLE